MNTLNAALTMFSNKGSSSSDKKLIKTSDKYTVIKSPKKTVYIVLEKNTQNPLGIFDTVEKAITSGNKITYHNCFIVPFIINDPCKYLFNTVYESPC